MTPAQASMWRRADLWRASDRARRASASAPVGIAKHPKAIDRVRQASHRRGLGQIASLADDAQQDRKAQSH